ncbi:unnamed protein product [Clavelina lepadiformis]|uniref:4-hydroxyphenylpyruvate dioxygenase n=1 Tax=Clavelina lepadiformis TaxID=159417 RepID=A0ABP0H2V0_CLALP
MTKRSIKEDSCNAICAGNTVYPVDTICDVCLCCSDIEDVLSRATSLDQCLFRTGTEHCEDTYGKVKFAVLKPPVGNVQHTLIDLSSYSGTFLPGFNLIDASKETVQRGTVNEDHLLKVIDHIAFALPVGQTDNVINWYSHVLGFSRLIINVDEDKSNGFVVQEGNKGLRLKAISSPNTDCLDGGKLSKLSDLELPKFVLCEPLDDNCHSSQIAHFLAKHKGSGVQHIAFSTTDIVNTIYRLKSHGLNCVHAPQSYYDNYLKRFEITKLNYTPELLRENDILLESHMNVDETSNDVFPFYCQSSIFEDQITRMNNTQWFIMQVFTKPIFEEKVVFFEIIQRFQTSSGFGAGNIAALWRAMQKEIFPLK